MYVITRTIVISLFVAILVISAFAQSTEFTYQGSLKDGPATANGNYDLEFALFDAGGSQIGATITRNGVAVAGGIFGVNLDFGSNFPGATRFLEIHVRQAGGGGFVVLSPRQPLTSAPYSVKSLSADNATNATNATNFTGSLAGDVTGTQGATTVARLQNRNVASTVPLDGQVLKYNAATSRWIPDTDIVGTGGGGGTITGVTPGTGLTGGGATGNVTVGIANSGVGTTQLADGAVTAPKIASGQVVKSLNTLTDNVTLAAGANITIIPAGNTLTIASIGGGSAILNQTTPQAGANFNISGNGIANALTANQYNIGAAGRILSAVGSNNTIAGIGAGSVNTGFSNSFFGTAAGFSNTTGSANSFMGNGAGLLNMAGTDNSFFGERAGGVNSSGGSNSFFGNQAGFANTTGGFNSFFGLRAGNVNTTGSNNTIVGTDADVASDNLSFATAIGSGAVVSSSNTIVLGRSVGQDTVNVPGAMTVTGALAANGSGLTNLNATNITTGTLANARLGLIPTANIADAAVTAPKIASGQVVKSLNTLTDNVTLAAGANITITPAGNTLTIASTGGGGSPILNQTTLQAGANFNISGNGTAGALSGNTVNSTTQYLIGGSSVLSVAGSANVFAGLSAGSQNTTGINNAFFGFGAGFSNLAGSGNSVFGSNAGSGISGVANTSIGAFAGPALTNLTNATAIGSRALVGTSNSLVLGSINGVNGSTADTNVGIGTSSPISKLDVRGDVFIGLTSVPPLPVGSDSLYVANTGGASQNSLRIDGFANNLFIAANSGAGAPLGAGIVFRTGPAGLTEFDRMSIDGAGNVRVEVLGSAGATQLCRNASNQISTCSSSLRYKTNIGRFSLGMSFVNKLRPISFDWKDGGMKDVGFGAEDIAKIDPRFVTFNDKGEVEGVKYDRIGVVLVNAVKEQQTQIEAQRKEIEWQSAKIDALMKLVCASNKNADICKEQ